MPRPENPETAAKRQEEQEELEAKALELVPEDRAPDQKLDRMKTVAEQLIKERAETLKELQNIRLEYTRIAEGSRWEPAAGSYDQILWFLENLPRKERKSKASNGETEVEETEVEEGIALE